VTARIAGRFRQIRMFQEGRQGWVAKWLGYNLHSTTAALSGATRAEHESGEK
jgi:hypothetical protein